MEEQDGRKRGQKKKGHRSGETMEKKSGVHGRVVRVITGGRNCGDGAVQGGTSLVAGIQQRAMKEVLESAWRKRKKKKGNLGDGGNATILWTIEGASVDLGGVISITEGRSSIGEVLLR